MWYYDQMRQVWINRETGATSRTRPAEVGAAAQANNPQPRLTWTPSTPSNTNSAANSWRGSNSQVTPNPTAQNTATYNITQPKPSMPQGPMRPGTFYVYDPKTNKYVFQEVKQPQGPLLPGASYKWNPMTRVWDYIPPPKPAAKATGGSAGAKASTGGKGKKVDPNAGKVLPALPPELQRYYEEQLSQARTAEDVAIAQARTAQRQALMQSAEQRRAAGRAAATGAVDAGAALASLGLGSSPALMGAALDEVYGTGGAGMLAADAARTAALENFLRAQEDAVGAGRRRKSELEDWRALQIAALSNEDLARMIGMSPGGKK